MVGTHYGFNDFNKLEALFPPPIFTKSASPLSEVEKNSAPKHPNEISKFNFIWDELTALPDPMESNKSDSSFKIRTTASSMSYKFSPVATTEKIIDDKYVSMDFSTSDEVQPNQMNYLILGSPKSTNSCSNYKHTPKADFVAHKTQIFLSQDEQDDKKCFYLKANETDNSKLIIESGKIELNDNEITYSPQEVDDFDAMEDHLNFHRESNQSEFKFKELKVKDLLQFGENEEQHIDHDINLEKNLKRVENLCAKVEPHISSCISKKEESSVFDVSADLFGNQFESDFNLGFDFDKLQEDTKSKLEKNKNKTTGIEKNQNAICDQSQRKDNLNLFAELSKRVSNTARKSPINCSAVKPVTVSSLTPKFNNTVVEKVNIDDSQAWEDDFSIDFCSVSALKSAKKNTIQSKVNVSIGKLN